MRPGTRLRRLSAWDDSCERQSARSQIIGHSSTASMVPFTPLETKRQHWRLHSMTSTSGTCSGLISPQVAPEEACALALPAPPRSHTRNEKGSSCSFSLPAARRLASLPTHLPELET